MNHRHTLLILALMLVAFSARATDSYEYGADEYVTIANGISPDGRWAITTHGEGEYGSDHFHLYLFDATAGKKLGPLEEISEFLDTGAGSYGAKWKKDSSEATIVYRPDRRVPLKAMTYRFGKGRAFPVTRKPVDLRDNDPLVDFWVEYCQKSRPPEQTFGTPKQHP